MQTSDKPDFATAIGAMLETFGQETTKPILHGYWLGLQDLPLQAVQSAVAQAIVTMDRIPKPVDLRRLAGEQTGDQRAIAAWNDVLRAVPLGSYKHVDFRDCLINATIRNLGGWPSFLNRIGSAEGEKWARIEFLKTYATMAASGVSGEVCLPLPGLAEATASGGELRAPEPVRIACDAERAKLAGPVRRTAIEATRDVPKVEFKRAQ